MQQDDLLPIFISDVTQSPHIPNSYSAPSIPQRSPSPIPTIFLKLNTAEIEVVDLADSTYDSDSEDSKQELKECK